MRYGICPQRDLNPRLVINNPAPCRCMALNIYTGYYSSFIPNTYTNPSSKKLILQTICRKKIYVCFITYAWDSLPYVMLHQNLTCTFISVIPLITLLKQENFCLIPREAEHPCIYLFIELGCFILMLSV